MNTLKNPRHPPLPVLTADPGRVAPQSWTIDGRMSELWATLAVILG